jgi:hypothetical protein
MIYTAPCIMFWMCAYPSLGEVGGGWALEFSSFLGPVKWHRADRRVPSECRLPRRPETSSTPGGQPLNAGYPGGQPLNVVNSGGQPKNVGYPGGQPPNMGFLLMRSIPPAGLQLSPVTDLPNSAAIMPVVPV